MSHLEGTEKIRMLGMDRYLWSNRYSICVTVILATDVLEPDTGPSSLFYLKLPLLLLSPIVSVFDGTLSPSFTTIFVRFIRPNDENGSVPGEHIWPYVIKWRR
jgi:hypothetical protein